MRAIYVDELYELHEDQEGFVRVRRTSEPAEDLERLRAIRRCEP